MILVWLVQSYWTNTTFSKKLVIIESALTAKIQAHEVNIICFMALKVTKKQRKSYNTETLQKFIILKHLVVILG